MTHMHLEKHKISKGTCMFRKNILHIKDSIFGNFKSEVKEFIEHQLQK